MICIGLSTMGSSSASIFRDDKLLFAVEEERLSRIKNDASFPIKSIKECLEKTNIAVEDVDYICVYWKPYNFLGRTLRFTKKIVLSPYFMSFYFKRINTAIFSNSNKNNYADFNGRWLDLFKIKKIFDKKIGIFKGNVKFIDHHMSHQSYCKALANNENSLNLSFDGGGENYSTKIVLIKNGNKKTLKNIKWPNSLGHFYSYFTGFLGFTMLEGEYKMMGLAPYGKDKYLKTIQDHILVLNKNGEYNFNHNLCDYHLALQGIYSDKVKNLFFANRQKDQKITSEHIDLAASVQKAFELALENMLNWCKKKYPDIHLLNISGGCALNVTANGKILSKKIFSKINVTPASNDAGCSIGAVINFRESKNLNVDSNSIKSPYLGSSFENKEIEKTFQSLNLSKPIILSHEDMIEKISGELAEKKIIAWFQGASEFGPRALGNRSFLADPRDDEIRNVLNSKIKKRELFRPFAPSILDYKLKDYFHTEVLSPYMSLVSKVKNEMKFQIPAVVHIDGTSRVHSVSKEMNPLYYNLINAFYKKTGVPVLLNTSLNIQEPIVYSPKDAIKTFFNSNVDYLCIGNYLCDLKWKNNNISNI